MKLSECITDIHKCLYTLIYELTSRIPWRATGVLQKVQKNLKTLFFQERELLLLSCFFFWTFVRLASSCKASLWKALYHPLYQLPCHQFTLPLLSIHWIYWLGSILSAVVVMAVVAEIEEVVSGLGAGLRDLPQDCSRSLWKPETSCSIGHLYR